MGPILSYTKKVKTGRKNVTAKHMIGLGSVV